MRKRLFLLSGAAFLSLALSNCSNTESPKTGETDLVSDTLSNKHANAQTECSSDVKERGLNGLVKSLKTYGAFVVAEAADGTVDTIGAEKTMGYDIEMYNGKGQCTETAQYSEPDSLNFKITTEYDGFGKKTKITYSSRWEKPDVECYCTYLPNGKIHEEFAYGYDYEDDAERCIFQKVVYEYDANGNPSSRSHYRIGEYGAPRFKYRSTYNDAHQRIEECRYNGKDELKERCAYTYNEAGRIATEEHSQAGLPYTKRYQYDINGLLTEIVEEMEDGCTTYKYDDKERIIERKSRFGDNSYEYRYDRHGNWTRQTAFEGERATYIIKREIEYYE